MVNKKWENKMKSLLHSLDINSGSDIDEVQKFAKSKTEFNKKIKKISADYKNNSTESNSNTSNNLDKTEELPSDIQNMLQSFFNELESPDSEHLDQEWDEDSDLNPKDPLLDTVMIWFYDLLMINNGRFKIVKNEDGSINIFFETDEIVKNKVKISVTDILTSEMNKLDKKSISKTKDKKLPPHQKPVEKKSTPKNTGNSNAGKPTKTRKTGKTTETKKGPKNKNPE